MNKKVVAGVVSGLVVLVMVWVGVVAAQVGSEASALHDMLESKLHAKATRDDLQASLTSKGFSVEPGATFVATGPKHSMLVYTTWLTVKAEFSAEGTMTSYHMDRAG